jgi:putative phosphoribosyl transferase
MIKEVISIPLSGLKLDAELVIPKNAVGIVVFSHGSGSSRLSPRNKFVASVMHQHHLATLLVDLLTIEEDKLYENRFDIDLISGRLIQITNWLNDDERTKKLHIGYFGASTGAASALRAASFIGKGVKCIVSRGGRPDLAIECLEKIKIPILFIVGELDKEVLDLNKTAMLHLHATKAMEIIPEATHLFEEKGTLEQVAELAAMWYDKYLRNTQ